MDVLYVSEADAVRDIVSLLAKVRAGAEVAIVNGDDTIAVMTPPGVYFEDAEPGHDEWFRAEVKKALHNEPNGRIGEKDAEKMMEQHRQAVSTQEHGSAAEYDAWFVARVDEALADPRESIDSEVVEAYFAKRRRASEMKMLGMAG